MTQSNPIQLVTRPNLLNQEVIEVLEHWLEMAKNGEILSVAIAAIREDLASHTQWSSCDNMQLLIGAAAILEYKLIKEIADD